MPTVATNTAANSALFYLNRNSANQSHSLAKISSGSRIVTSADDAAGLAVSDQLVSDITSLQQAAQTTQQVEALLQIADGGLARITDILQRMKALAVQYNSGTVDATSQGFINDEYGELVNQINLIETSVQYNGDDLLDGGFSPSVVVGIDAADTISIDLSSANVDATSLGLAATITGTGDIGTIDTAIGTIGTYRATVGALTSAVQFQGENIDTQIQNLQAATSSIRDVDIAEEQTNFTNFQVLTEAAISGLAQANEMKTSLLALLR
ncbi:MAG: flagellin [Bdellovibrionales bacterium]